MCHTEYNTSVIFLAWIDYRKALDITSHTHILLVLEWLGVNDSIVKSIEKLMPLWKTLFPINSSDHLVRQRWYHAKD